MGRVVTAAFSPGCRFTQAQGSLWQYDYGTVLHLTGPELPAAVEIHFATVERGGESETRIGITADGVTEVKIPDALLEMAKTQDYNLYAFVYLDDGKSGQTEYKILMTVRARPKPGEEHPDTEKDHPLADAVRAVNAAADRAETAAGNAAESKAAAEDAAEQADKSRVAAETVAKHVDEAGRTALTGITSAKTDAAETIETAKTGAVKTVDAARETGVKAVADARTAAEQSLSEAKTDGVAAIETAKTEGLQAIDKAKNDIETARSGAIKDIDAAKTSGVQAVEAVTAGIEQTKTAAVQAVEAAENEGVAAVNAAVEAGKTNFVTDESLTLSGRAADAKIVGDELAKKADQTELEDVKKRQNILVGSETGSRVCVTDAFETPLEGLVLYGKSTQVTTTGTQLIDINSFQKDNSVSVKIVNNYSIELTSTIKKDASDSSKVYSNVLIDADILVGKTITMSYDEWNSNVPNETVVCGIMYNINGKNYYEHLKNSRIKTVTIPLGAKDCKVRLFLIEGVSTTVKAGTYTAIIKGLMICEGTVAKSWEPCTGGKPSPSPDYPQEIQSVGVSGYVNVTVKGKNLLPDQDVTSYYVSMNGLFGFAKGNYSKIFRPENGRTYYVTRRNIGSRFRVVCTDELPSGQTTITPTNAVVSDNKKKIELTATGKYMIINVENNAALNGLMVSISQDDQYEPYHEPQSMSVTTPNGLPGIPVSSGGNYTDEQGQQWICDEVDMEHGLYVQRINELAFDQLSFSYEKTPVNHNDTFIASIDEQLSGTETGHAMCQYAYFDGVSYELAMQEDCRCYVWRNNVTIQFRDSVGVNTLEAFAEWLISHPKASISYVLATPIETPLSETDIAAYRALTTYGPTTIVETDGAGMKLDYQRDVNIVIKQLTDTIASMTN